MSEPLAADQFITTALKADSALAALIGGATPRVYADMAPQGTPATPLPYVLLQMQAATDLMVVGSFRVWTNMLYLCRGLAETNSWGGNLETIASRITAVLHAASGTNVSGVVYSCTREQPFRLVETVDGRVIRHSGGIFRIYAKAS